MNKNSLRAIAGATMTIVGGALFACGSQAPESPGGDAIATSSEAYDTVDGLIGPSTCTLQGGHLYKCAIPTRPLQGLPLASTAVPLRTTFSVQKSGDCFTQYPLEVTFSADGADNVRFQYLPPNATTSIRRKDGQPMQSVTVTDSSKWTKLAIFDPSCRVSLSVSSNEPDVNTKAEAQGIIDGLRQDLAAKTSIAEHYQQLTLYSQAYLLLKSVANGFLEELNNDSIQSLRAAANDAVTAIATLEGTCGDSILTDADRANLLLLYSGLGQLGSTDQWTKPDGGLKTLADFFGADQAKILATVEKLAQQTQTDGGSSYDADYKAAALAQTQAKTKLEQALKQLASWGVT
jgi:hypothetical protein